MNSNFDDALIYQYMCKISELISAIIVQIFI